MQEEKSKPERKRRSVLHKNSQSERLSRMRRILAKDDAPPIVKLAADEYYHAVIALEAPKLSAKRRAQLEKKKNERVATITANGFIVIERYRGFKIIRATNPNRELP